MAISVPSNWSFVEIHENLLGLEIFLESPRAELAPKARLLVATPRSFHIRRLHVVHPHDSGPQRFDDAKCLIDVTRPYGGGEPVWRVVRDADRVAFAIERNHRCNRAENFFPRDPRRIVDIVEN